MPIITPVKGVVSVLGVNIAPDNSLYGEALPKKKRGTFSGFSYINEQGNLSLQSVKGPERAGAFYGCIKTTKLSGLVIYSTVFKRG